MVIHPAAAAAAASFVGWQPLEGTLTCAAALLSTRPALQTPRRFDARLFPHVCADKGRRITRYATCFELDATSSLLTVYGANLIIYEQVEQDEILMAVQGSCS